MVALNSHCVVLVLWRKSQVFRFEQVIGWRIGSLMVVKVFVTDLPLSHGFFTHFIRSLFFAACLVSCLISVLWRVVK